jgi:hypothetical protein
MYCSEVTTIIAHALELTFGLNTMPHESCVRAVVIFTNRLEEGKPSCFAHFFGEERKEVSVTIEVSPNKPPIFEIYGAKDILTKKESDGLQFFLEMALNRCHLRTWGDKG